jgi:hypothetical protein
MARWMVLGLRQRALLWFRKRFEIELNYFAKTFISDVKKLLETSDPLDSVPVIETAARSAWRHYTPSVRFRSPASEVETVCVVVAAVQPQLQHGNLKGWTT